MTKLKEVERKQDIEAVALALLGVNSSAQNIVDDVLSNFTNTRIRLQQQPHQSLVDIVTNWVGEHEIVERDENE